jgi:hypothetical protein
MAAEQSLGSHCTSSFVAIETTPEARNNPEAVWPFAFAPPPPETHHTPTEEDGLATDVGKPFLLPVRKKHKCTRTQQALN